MRSDTRNELAQMAEAQKMKEAANLGVQETPEPEAAQEAAVNTSSHQLADYKMEELWNAFVGKAREISDSPHSAALHAFIRQGADEISQVLAAFPEGVQPVAELGQIFEPTSQEVTWENNPSLSPDSRLELF